MAWKRGGKVYNPNDYPAWVKHFFFFPFLFPFQTFLLINLASGSMGPVTHAYSYHTQSKRQFIFICFLHDFTFWLGPPVARAFGRCRHIFLFEWIFMTFLFELYLSLKYILRAVTQPNRIGKKRFQKSAKKKYGWPCEIAGQTAEWVNITAISGL